MSSVSKDFSSALSALSVSLDAIPNDEPFNIAHGNWSFPGVSKSDLQRYVGSIIDLMKEVDFDSPASDVYFDKCIVKVNFLIGHTIPQMWGAPTPAVSVFMETLRPIKDVLLSMQPNENVRGETSKTLRKTAVQVRAMEARLKDLEPRSGQLNAMIERIESAHDAALELPADLEQLAEDREKIKKLLFGAELELEKIINFRVSADSADVKIEKSLSDAATALAKCEEAYSSSTSVGLAAAFSERSIALNSSIRVWVGGLVVALIAGATLGRQQLSSVIELASTPGVSDYLISANMLLAAVSVGGPIWLAWLSTKQIGQRFRLSEDYAFKASISRAYEGYRREAAKVAPELEAKLLASALTRLDELPIRLIDTASHGSPWHELMSSDVVKGAVNAVPGFANSVKELAASAINKASGKGGAVD